MNISKFKVEELKGSELIKTNGGCLIDCVFTPIIDWIDRFIQ